MNAGEVAEFLVNNRANFLTELAAGIGFGLLSVTIQLSGVSTANRPPA